MAEWTKQEYEVAMQQRDELFPGFAEEQEEEGEETAENMLNLLCQRNRAFAALTHLRDKCRTYGGPKGGKMDLSEANEAIAACTEGK